MRCIRQATAAAVLAALVVLGTAAMASAAFSARSTGTLSAPAFKLQPPTGLSATCSKRMPVVTFTSSTSSGVVPDHPGATPPQVLGYTTTLKVSGKTDLNGTLGPLATQWSGLKQSSGAKLTLTIVTTYGNWSSAAATTLTFTC